MGKNQSASGLTNVIQYSNGNITFVSGSTTLMSISSSGAITTTGVISGSNALSASYAANADTLDGLDSTVFTLTSSFNAQTASFTAFTASILAQTASLNAFSASILSYTASQNITNGTFTLTSSFNAQTASFTAFSASINAFSASVLTFTGSAATRLGALESYTSSLNDKTSSFATTGSNTFIGNQVVSGSIVQSGSFTTTGTIIAQTINVQTVTSSIIYSSGSNIFGNLLNDSQRFTGSVLITGSLTISTGGNASAPTIFGSTIACSPIGCFATSCATSFIGGTMSGTTIYGSTAVCSAVGKFTSCIDAGSGTFSSSVTAKGTLTLGDAGVTNAIINSADGMYFNLDTDLSGGSPEFMFGKGRSGAGSGGTTFLTIASTGAATFTGNITVDKSSPVININPPSGTSGQYNINNGVGSLMWAMYTTTGGSNAQGNWMLYSAGKTGGAGNIIDITPAGVATFSSTITGTTIYGSTAVCSPVGKFTTCIDAGSGTFSGNVTLSSASSVLDVGGVLYVRGNGSVCATHDFNTGVANVALYQQRNAAGTVINQFNAGGCSYFNSGCNVGINCTAPNYKLHINGCTAIDGNLRMGSGYSSGNSTDPGITVQGYSNAGVYFSNCGVGLGAGSSSNLLFLSCIGNVGIGICTPIGKLHVYKNGLSAVIGKMSDANILIDSGDYGVSTYNAQIAFGYYSGTFTYAPVAIGFIPTTGTASGYGDLTFNTRALTTDTAPIERMRITSCGKVGILATDPKWLLEICCNTTATGAGGYPAMSINNPNDAGYSAYYFFKGAGNMGGIEVSNATCDFLLNTNCTLSFKTNNNTRIRICNTGETYFTCKPYIPGASLTCIYTCTFASYCAGCWYGLFAGDNGYNGAYAFTVVGQLNLNGSSLYSMNYSTVPYIHSSTSIGSTNGNDIYGVAHTSAGHADNGALVCFRRARYSSNTPVGNRTEFCMNVSYSTSFTATTYVLAWV